MNLVGVLHLTPLQHAVQMRPSFAHLGRGRAAALSTVTDESDLKKKPIKKEEKEPSEEEDWSKRPLQVREV